MKRFLSLNLGFTLATWLIFSVLACVAAYLYAQVRGDLLPDGTVALNGPRGFWVGMNFRAFLPYFLGVAAILGVLVGQLQFAMWMKRGGDPGC